MPDLNTVAIDAIKHDLGTKGLREIAQLRNWLSHLHAQPSDAIPSDREIAEFKGRYAASIITRAEADLLGISLPRFSYRLYLNHSGGFVNCRRVGTMCSNVRPLGRRSAVRAHQDENLREVPERRGWPADTIQKGTVVADSLLVPPASLAERFHILTVNLGRAYGELGDIAGTPYIKNFDLTGLCAQACCFMANALLADHAAGLFGIGEISQLAFSKESGPAEMEIFGLGKIHFSTYFRHPKVGLNAFWHSVKKSTGGPSEATRFSRIASAYLESGFPVIVLLDAGRIAGISPTRMVESKSAGTKGETSIYAANGLDTKIMREYFETSRIRSHAVTLVGCDRSGDEFLFNDPGRLPFMKATAQQLWNARAYHDEYDGTIRNPVPRPEDYRFKLLPLQFLPCVPSRVKLPLVDDELSKEETMHPLGNWTLEKVARRIFQSVNQSPAARDRQAAGRLRYDASRARLIPYGRLAEWVVEPANPLQLRSEQAASLAKLLEKGADSLPSRWVWVVWHRGPDAGEVPSLWIFDAETDPKEIPFSTGAAEGENAARFLLSGIEGDPGTLGQWRIRSPLPGQNVPPAEGCGSTEARTWGIEPEENRARDGRSDDPPEVRLSLLTSFSAKGFDSALEHWPSGFGEAELYCFMHEEAPRYLPQPWLRRVRGSAANWIESLHGRARNWFREREMVRFNRTDAGGFHRETKSMPALPLRRSHVPSAVDAMAAMADDVGEIDRVAKAIVARFAEKKLAITALASYFPELSSGDRARRDNGIRALRFLIRLGAALRRTQIDRGILSATDFPAMPIEFVGGTVMGDVFRAERQYRPDYDRKRLVVNVRCWGEAMDRLLESLLQVAPEAKRRKVQLMAEMEPGPGYVLGNAKRVSAFLSLVAVLPKLRGVVGINCDWAHWHFIEGHSLGLLGKKIRDAMGRGHFSDHHGGAHMGDVGIGEIHRDWADYEEFFSHFSRNGGRGGSVSLELEAAKNTDAISLSFRRLKDFGINLH